MISLKKAKNKLIKHYDKNLKKLHKICIKDNMNCMNYFVYYLQYMRDVYLLTLTAEDANTLENVKVDTLATAIKEYTEYANCIFKYYDVSATNVTKKIDSSDEEVHAKYIDEKLAHWKNFWTIVAQNMESWFD